MADWQVRFADRTVRSLTEQEFLNELHSVLTRLFHVYRGQVVITKHEIYGIGVPDHLLTPADRGRYVIGGGVGRPAGAGHRRSARSRQAPPDQVAVLVGRRHRAGGWCRGRAVRCGPRPRRATSHGAVTP
jgi:hypothetical protein